MATEEPLTRDDVLGYGDNGVIFAAPLRAFSGDWRSGYTPRPELWRFLPAIIPHHISEPWGKHIRDDNLRWARGANLGCVPRCERNRMMEAERRPFVCRQCGEKYLRLLGGVAWAFCSTRCRDEYQREATAARAMANYASPVDPTGGDV